MNSTKSSSSNCVLPDLSLDEPGYNTGYDTSIFQRLSGKAGKIINSLNIEEMIDLAMSLHHMQKDAKARAYEVDSKLRKLYNFFNTDLDNEDFYVKTIKKVHGIDVTNVMDFLDEEPGLTTITRARTPRMATTAAVGNGERNPSKVRKHSNQRRKAAVLANASLCEGSGSESEYEPHIKPTSPKRKRWNSLRSKQDENKSKWQKIGNEFPEGNLEKGRYRYLSGQNWNKTGKWDKHNQESEGNILSAKEKAKQYMLTYWNTMHNNYFTFNENIINHLWSLPESLRRIDHSYDNRRQKKQITNPLNTGRDYDGEKQIHYKEQNNHEEEKLNEPLSNNIEKSMLNKRLFAAVIYNPCKQPSNIFQLNDDQCSKVVHKKRNNASFEQRVREELHHCNLPSFNKKENFESYVQEDSEVCQKLRECQEELLTLIREDKENQIRMRACAVHLMKHASRANILDNADKKIIEVYERARKTLVWGYIPNHDSKQTQLHAGHLSPKFGQISKLSQEVLTVYKAATSEAETYKCQKLMNYEPSPEELEHARMLLQTAGYEVGQDPVSHKGDQRIRISDPLKNRTSGIQEKYKQYNEKHTNKNMNKNMEKYTDKTRKTCESTD